jgi:hypothetical protein
VMTIGGDAVDDDDAVGGALMLGLLLFEVLLKLFFMYEAMLLFMLFEGDDGDATECCL